MKKILGLDLGTNSIGWALVNEAENENEKSEIIKLGVRVNPLTVDELSNFEKGKSFSVNAGRTLKRSMRRNLQRYKLRRENLIEILKKHNFISDETILSETGNKTTFETYSLRAKSASEKISLQEFARVLLMINKKRGYKSSRKTKSEDEGQAIDGMEVAKILYNENITPGQYCLSLLENGKKQMPEFYRSDLQVEFDRVWNKQKEFYPEILTDDLKENLRGKNEKQTWAICKEPFNIVGAPRTTKGDEQKKENFSWRAKALSEKIDLESLAIVLQKINSQINGSSGYLGAISDRSKELYFNDLTVGQYQMNILSENSNASLKNMVFYRQDYLHEFETIWDTQAKFHKELTAELKSEIKDVVIFYQRKLKSQKGLLSFCEFESRKIVVEVEGVKKTKTAGMRVIPRSSPLFQEFKIWQILNIVELTDKETGETCIRLTQEQKEELFKELQKKEKLSEKDTLAILFGNKAKNWAIAQSNFKEKIEGDKTQAKIFDILGDNSDTSTSSVNIDLLPFDSTKEPDEQHIFKLWHLLYSYEGDNSKSGVDSLLKKLKEDFGFDDEVAKKLSNVSFQDDYGSLSAKAIRKILPFLREGHQYDVACEYAGYRHSKSSLTKEEIENKILKDKLDNLPKNSLRNPVVEKILNQMVNTVNGVIDAFGKPDEIRIELARELKKNAKERDSLTKAIGESTRNHERIRKIIESDFNLPRISRNDIIRYKLYEELENNGFKTLYSGTYIPREKLFSKEFDIEHIIPQSRLFDDSFANKTLEARDINIEKSNRTAFDFVKEKYGKTQAEEYLLKVEKLMKDSKISRTKFKHLTWSEKDIPEDFINRDLADTQYITKYAKTMLHDLVKRVVSTTGSITDNLREDWQLVDIMKELNLEKYKALGLVEYEQDKDGRQIAKIEDWSKRNDHRHHAMDALTVAFTKDAFVQFYNNMNAKSNDRNKKYSEIFPIWKKYFTQDGKNKAIPPMPLNEFRADAKKHLENTLISIKAKNKVVTKNMNKSQKIGGTNKKMQLTPRGQLHNETIYGSIKLPNVKVDKKTGKKIVEMETVYTIRKEIGPDLKLDKVIDLKIRKILQARLAEFGGDAKKAFVNLEENPIWQNKEKGIAIKRVAITGVSNAEALHKKRDKDGNILLDENGKEIPVDFVSTSNNHHVAIYRVPVIDKKTKLHKLDENSNPMFELQEKVVSFYEAVARINKGLSAIDKEYKSGENWQFLFTMKQNEYFVFPNEKTGFNPSEIDLLNSENYGAISPNLFRVQKISTKNYFFRHHLETKVSFESKEVEKAMRGIAWELYQSTEKVKNLVKVRVNHIGQIVSVGEY